MIETNGKSINERSGVLNTLEAMEDFFQSEKYRSYDDARRARMEKFELMVRKLITAEAVKVELPSATPSVVDAREAYIEQLEKYKKEHP